MSMLPAFAAGLGKLTINSALGQPLSAEIELVSLQPGEFEALVGRVASVEAYADAKIEFSSVLRQLRFATDKRSDGKPILRITSIGPVNEPFLDVLVEMTWPAGRLLREYPLLLDPPGFSEARVAPSVPVAAVSTKPPAAAPTPSPTPVESAPAPTTAQVAAPIAPSGTPSARKETGGDTYGPVKQGETLSKIARELKSDTVSLEQMLVALYRENKAAFIGDNMNRLRTGQILKVPSASEVGQIAEKEARAEMKAQVDNWNAYREQVASAAPAATSKPAPTNQATGKIAVAKPDAAPAATGKDSLKIAQTDAANAKTGAAGAAGVAKLQTEITALKEEKIARENALKEANSRVADLEKQIGDMRKLMELKGLGKDGKPDPKAAAKPDVKAPEPAKPVDTKVAQVTPPAKPGEPPKVDAKPADAKPADAKPADAKPAEAKPGDAKPAEAKPAEAPKVADAKPAPPKAAAKAPPPPPEPSFLEEWGVVLGGGAATLLAGGGIFAFMRSRKKKAEKGPSSTSLGKPSSIMPSDLKPNTSTGGKSGGGLVDTGNSSFLTDFDKTGPGSIDTDEVDPVAEAEVYIAYGRDAQAEEILKEAMVKDKSRHEVTVKLLEIYHARKSIQAFDTVARELRDAIGTDTPMWAKVAAMGASIDPQNSLYAGSGQAYATTGAFSAAGEGIQAEKPDVDFDLGFNSAATTSQSATFDVTGATTDQPAAASADFDLDLGMGGAVEMPAASAPADSGGLDFDLALGGDSAPAPATAAAAPPAPAADSGFDFDLSALSMDTPTPAAEDFTKTMAMTSTPAHEKTASLNLGELSLDLGDSKPAAALGGASDSAVSTKLELAKAYVEIGDSDGAKEILNEVAREGSPAQQAEAKKILAGL